MKSILVKFTALSAGILLSAGVYAQDSAAGSQATELFSPSSSFRTWSIGVNAGALAPVVLSGKNDFTSWKLGFGYGAYIKKQISPAFGLQANFLGGKLQGDNSNTLGNGSAPASPYSSFETRVAYATSLNAYLSLGDILWMNRKSHVYPYITAGYGLMGYKIELTDNAGTVSEINSGKNVEESFLPVGAGLKFSLSDHVNLDLGYTMHFVDGDNLDGYHSAPQNDKFSFTRIGLEFALGPKTKPQLAGYNPVAAMQDDYIAKNVALQAELAAERARNAERLGQIDAEWKRYLSDSDKDGVSDHFDKCPDTPEGVQVDGSGCEIKVTTVNPVKVVVTEEDRRVVAEAIKNLEFDFAKSTIRASSHASLNRVADLLKSKDFSLKLAGHTDNVGSDAANLKLSKDRAESVKAYLVGQGANPSRIEATGYGESQPIESNNTASGRQANRRVEFTLY